MRGEVNIKGGEMRACERKLAECRFGEVTPEGK